ncbi:MAG TPA: LEA type 2 family protein [Anaeromyxobacteraceae bacterium]|nr:LEA type 2 family protein [Anaeromyxobacteraceae bacterium]
MTRSRRAFLLALLPLAATLGCATAKKRPAPEFPKPRLTLQSADVRSLDLGGASLAFGCLVENPLDAPVTLSGARWQLDVMGHRVAAGEVPGGVAVAGLATAPVQIDAVVRFRDVPRFAFEMVRHEEVAYRLAVIASVATPAGPAEVPLVHDGKFKGPRMPEFAIEGIKIRSLSPTKASADVRLEVKNVNDFPMPSGSIGWELQLSGRKVAAARGEIGKLPSGGTAVVAFPVEISMLGAGRGLLDAIRRGRFDSEVKGTATWEGMAVPVDVRRAVDVER